MKRELPIIFKSPFIYIILAIVAVGLFLGVILYGESKVAARDQERKAVVSSYLEALDLFKSDFGFYPNYSMKLGFSDGGEVSYDLADQLSLCDWHKEIAVADDLKTAQLDLGQAYLRPGYRSVGRLLQCLDYLKELKQDPIWERTYLDYQYRVSHDYQEAVVVARLEGAAPNTSQNNLNSFVIGATGSNNRSLLEGLGDSFDADNFKSFDEIEIGSSRYLYQCLISAEDEILRTDQRSDELFKPYIDSVDSAQLPNPNCRDSISGLLVLPTH